MNRTIFLLFCYFLIAVALEVPLYLGDIKPGGQGKVVMLLLTVPTSSFVMTQHVHSDDMPLPTDEQEDSMMERAAWLLSLAAVKGKRQSTSCAYLFKFTMQLEQAMLP